MGVPRGRRGEPQPGSWKEAAAAAAHHASLQPCNHFTTPFTQVKGFNVRRWVRDNKKKLPALLESMAKLVNAGKLRAEFTE